MLSVGGGEGENGGGGGISSTKNLQRYSAPELMRCRSVGQRSMMRDRRNVRDAPSGLLSYV